MLSEDERTEHQRPGEFYMDSTDAMSPVQARGAPSEHHVPSPAPADADDKTEEKQQRRLLTPTRLVIAAVVLGAVAIAGLLYWDHAKRFATTDDAFIAARQFAVATKVSGYLVSVPVTDNQHVDTGAVIAQIDDRDYRAALDQTEAQVASAEASVENIDAQMAVQQAQIAQSAAQVGQQKATLDYAQQQAGRYGTLAKDGWGTKETAQNWVSQQQQAQAGLGSAEQSVVAATRQVAVLKAQRAGAVANVQQAQAQRDQARLNLEYTTVKAAQPGRVVQLSGAVGQFVPAGTAIAMFVPDTVWVTANFKEIQLDRMRPGQPVTVHIDAYPRHDFAGRVDSVQPGSGTAFSLLPAQNATGNYVKIVQRVPVKIALDAVPPDVALGPGMSVEPRVRVDPRPSWWERMRRAL